MKINGIEYFFVDTNGAKEALMFLHGFTGSSTNWERHIQRFASNYRVIAVDLLGHGKTESPALIDRYQMENVAVDLIAILDKLEISQVNLLGYSMGGRLALYTSVAFPERVQRLILESASPGLRTPEEQTARIQSDEALADSIERDGIAAFVESWENLPLFATQKGLPEAERRRLHDLRLCNNPSGLANSLRGMGTGVQPALWDRLQDVTLPVLIMAGALDTKFVEIAGQMHNRMPNSRLEIIPDAGHTIHLEQPELFQQKVLAFLRQRENSDLQ
jgi:2-succinyl-6-hydroxy-2,4-cyclohexadiene-1-carboxylate synthase